jgi:hypothetical protein
MTNARKSREKRRMEEQEIMLHSWKKNRLSRCVRIFRFSHVVVVKFMRLYVTMSVR